MKAQLPQAELEHFENFAGKGVNICRTTDTEWTEVMVVIRLVAKKNKAAGRLLITAWTQSCGRSTRAATAETVAEKKRAVRAVLEHRKGGKQCHKDLPASTGYPVPSHEAKYESEQWQH
jgi:hypothetical protein